MRVGPSQAMIESGTYPPYHENSPSCDSKMDFEVAWQEILGCRMREP
jgi:hypothetical protein